MNDLFLLFIEGVCKKNVQKFKLSYENNKYCTSTYRTAGITHRKKTHLGAHGVQEAVCRWEGVLKS